MSFKIEHDIPAPEGGSRKYPFNQMKPGDSFLINGGGHQAVSSAATNFAKGSGRGWKFTVKRTNEGYRCWRIS